MVTCYAVESPAFQPALRIVTAITNEVTPTVTTSFDHDYISGLIVSFRVPKTFGMTQINKLVGTITVTGVTTFTVDINTFFFDVFAIPASDKQCAQVLPVGQINSLLSSAVQNVL